MSGGLISCGLMFVHPSDYALFRLVNQFGHTGLNQAVIDSRRHTRMRIYCAH